jgi:hypothetical protein
MFNTISIWISLTITYFEGYLVWLFPPIILSLIAKCIRIIKLMTVRWSCRPRHGRYDSITMDNEETAWEGQVAFF